MKDKRMINHIILTVSDVERSLTFYEAALKPIGIRFSCPTRVKMAIPTSGDSETERELASGSSKGSLTQVRSIGASMPITTLKSMSFIRPQ